tara:strand:+ start:234 stop:662 length:429 start_codon:yes stop_codon:yes gene_type:complete
MTETAEDIENFYDLLKKIALFGLEVRNAYKADPKEVGDIMSAFDHMLRMNIAELNTKLGSGDFVEDAKFHREQFQAIMDTAEEEYMTECANPRCDKRFIPRNKKVKYHSDKCRKRARVNRYRKKKRAQKSKPELGAAQGVEE